MAFRVLDQAGLPEHAQVMRDGLLRQAERLGEQASAGFAGSRDAIEDRHACRVGERLEAQGEPFGVRAVERRAGADASGLFEKPAGPLLRLSIYPAPSAPHAATRRRWLFLWL